MNIILTGYSGLFGSNYIQQFKKAHNFGFIGRKVPPIEGEFLEYDFSTGTNIPNMSGNYSSIIHLAGQSAIWYSKKNISIDCQINLIGTIKLIEFALRMGINKIIIFSTCDIYGNIPFPNEDSKISLMNPYSLGKYCMEEYVSYFRKSTNLKIYIVRPTFIIGHGLKRNPLFDIVSGFVKNEINLFISMQSKIDFIHTDDLGKAINCLVSKDYTFDSLNLFSNNLTQLNEIYEKLSLKTGISPPINYLENGQNRVLVKGVSSIRKFHLECQKNIHSFTYELYNEIKYR